jgi:hypothetical protein|eukprot:COSAG06_NODE_4735_length_3992_cov_4.927067_3_plen_149_part_00
MARLPEPIDAYPATYRHHVYYCAGAEERAEFLSHPVMYVAEAPPVPEVNTCVSVVGPPCSGKTSVSTRLAKQLGVPLLSAAAALAAAATANDALGVAVRPAKHASLLLHLMLKMSLFYQDRLGTNKGKPQKKSTVSCRCGRRQPRRAA